MAYPFAASHFTPAAQVLEKQMDLFGGEDDEEEDEVAEKLRENSHWVISKDRK